MPLDLTPIGSRHAVDVCVCPHKPAGNRLVIMPLPGAPAYVCTTPCGRGCCPFTAAAVPPLPQPAALCLPLGLAATSAALVAAVRAGAEPVGTAGDLDAPRGCGSHRYYRN